MFSWLKLTMVFCCLAVTSADSNKKLDGDETLEAVLGVHVQTLKEPLWYHSLVPILFEVPLPKWNLSDITTTWPYGFGSSCQENDQFVENWSSMSCPVDFYLHSVIERTYENILSWVNLLPTQNENPVLTDFRCGEIHPHFNTYLMTEEMRQIYIENGIKSCHPREYIHVNMSTFRKDVNQTVYNEMLNRFIEEFTTPLKHRINGFVKYATTINAHTSFQLAELLDFYQTSEIFKNALITCSNYRLPFSIVKKKDLESALNEIMKIFYRKNFKLTLPVTDLDAYFKQEISDCIVTTKSTLLIRVLVPLTKMDFPLEMVKLSKIPFLKTSKKKNTTKICAYETTDNHFIKDAHLNHFFPTDCKPNEFCKVPDIANRKVQRTCINALLSMNTDLASKYCGLTCDHISPQDLPVFQRIDDNRYTISGKNSDLEVFVSCGNQPFKLVSPPANGALEVILPCNCQLVFKAETMYSYGKCNISEVIFTEIVPHDWTSDEYFSDELDHYAKELADDRAGYENLEYYINVQFTILSIVIILIMLTNVSLCYLVLGILQRMNKLHNPTGANGAHTSNARKSTRRQILDVPN